MLRPETMKSFVTLTNSTSEETKKQYDSLEFGLVSEALKA